VPPLGSINADKGLNPLGIPCNLLMLEKTDAALLCGEGMQISKPFLIAQQPSAKPDAMEGTLSAPDGEEPNRGDDLHATKDDGNTPIAGDQPITLTFVDNALEFSEDMEFSITIDKD
jgi:hypothetical protein